MAGETMAGGDILGELDAEPSTSPGGHGGRRPDPLVLGSRLGRPPPESSPPPIAPCGGPIDSTPPTSPTCWGSRRPRTRFARWPGSPVGWRWPTRVRTGRGEILAGVGARRLGGLGHLRLRLTGPARRLVRPARVSAEQCGQRALSLAREFDLLRHPSTTDAFLALAYVARERDEIDAAASLLEEADARAHQTSPSLIPMLLALQRAMLALSIGRPGGGPQTHGAVPRRRPPGVSPRCPLSPSSGRRPPCWPAIGDVDGAQRVLDLAGQPATVDEQAVATRLAVERGDVATARQLLARRPPNDDRHAASRGRALAGRPRRRRR